MIRTHPAIYCRPRLRADHGVRGRARSVGLQMSMSMKASIAAAALLLGATFAASGQDAKPEASRVRLAVGGKPALFYLPLTVTERLGYFPDAGVEGEIFHFPGGARAL